MKKIRRLRTSGVFLAFAAVAATTACDTSVTKPGPVSDDQLDKEVALPAVVNGMARALARALNYIAYTGAGASHEIVASSFGGLFGITLRQQQGILDPAIDETNDHWVYAQQARWVAEDGVRRIRLTLGDRFGASVLAAQALVHVGYANRLLGENMCVGVINSGPSESRSVYFERAQSAFTEAIGIARSAGDTQLESAARAGRAAVRVWLNDWVGALSDASLVPLEFVYQARYSAIELDQYNRIYWANANQPYRNHSVVGTFVESYYQASGDPRTPWNKNPAIPTGTANVPWYFETKFDRRDSPINLASGREMRLIIAESLLQSGDWEGSLAEINQLRISIGVAPWTASSADETWAVLRRERGIELWLEGRRVGDLYRWYAAGRPGDAADTIGRHSCFPIGQTELSSNPNL
jgi:hypothetical protein